MPIDPTHLSNTEAFFPQRKKSRAISPDAIAGGNSFLSVTPPIQEKHFLSVTPPMQEDFFPFSDTTNAGTFSLLLVGLIFAH